MTALPWDRLVAAAMLGTGRRAADFAPPGEIGQILAASGAETAEAALLNAASGLAVLRRVGRRPPGGPPPESPAAPEETCPPLPRRASRFLLALFAGSHPPALAEFLAAAAEAGFRIREADLPAALAFGAAHREHRAALRRLLGSRGGWLATLNPDWRFAIGAEADSAERIAALWETATGAARPELLRQARGLSPALGRSLLSSTWKTDSADERAEFLAALAIGLGPEDEPFLEASLDDKGKRVRAQAATLLARIPDSRLAQRMRDRLAPLLVLRTGKAGLGARARGTAKHRLEVTLPEECDQALQRDGIEAKPPAGEKQLGAQAWVLQQLLARVAPSFWCGTWQAEPAALIAAARASDWEAPILAGWSRATAEHRDAGWAVALVEGGVIAPELLAVLPPAAKETLALAALGRGPAAFEADAAGSTLLAACDHAWTVGFSRTVLQAARRFMEQPQSNAAWHLHQQWPLWAARMPVELAADAAAAGPAPGEWRKTHERFLQLLQFRHDMLRSIRET